MTPVLSKTPSPRVIVPEKIPLGDEYSRMVFSTVCPLQKLVASVPIRNATAIFVSANFMFTFSLVQIRRRERFLLAAQPMTGSHVWKLRNVSGCRCWCIESVLAAARRTCRRFASTAFHQQTARKSLFLWRWPWTRRRSACHHVSSPASTRCAEFATTAC